MPLHTGWYSLPVCLCRDNCCNHTTATNATLPVCPTDKLAPQTAVALSSLDPLLEGLTIAALSLASVNPAPSVSPTAKAMAAPFPHRPTWYPNTNVDWLLDMVYGNVHANPGSHLSDNLSDYQEWQTNLSHLIYLLLPAI